MKKILVIGSNSFAGSNLIFHLLENKYKVVGISRSKESNKIYLKYKRSKHLNNFSFNQLDINKDLNKIINLIVKKKPEFIINFAAQGMVNESWISPTDWYQTNILSQTKLFEKIKFLKFIKRLIYFSTPEVFGENKESLKENALFNPSTPYAVSRAAFENHLKINSKIYKIPITITRTSNIFGPHQPFYRIIPKTIIKLIRNQKIYLDGLGKSKRSFIFMDDVSNALIKMIKKKNPSSFYHISTNEFISTEFLVLKISKILNKKKSLIIKKKQDRLGKDSIYKLNSSKLRKDLGWKENYSLLIGLKNTINWIKDNFSTVKKNKIYYVHKT